MLEIYITRHGETQWNKVRRFQGQGDSELTELGKQQAGWLGQRLKNIGIKTIYSSPLGRAKHTSEIMNAYIGAKIIFDDRLKEMHVGDWEGRMISDIEVEMPTAHSDFWHNPKEFSVKGQESFESVQNRAAEFFEDLLKKHCSGRIFIVAHAIVIKGLLNYIQGRDVEHFWEGKHILPTSLTRINADEDRLSVVYMSDVSHYEKPMEQGWFIDEV